MERKRGINKKGQLTIFIILGLLILFVVILLFMQNEKFRSIFTGGKSPVEQIEDCLKDNVEEGLEILMLQGGSIEPQNYYLYDGNMVDYTCYTEENYDYCVMQKPLLKNSIEEELKNYANPKIKECISSVRESLENGGARVTMKDPELVIEIFPKNILVEIDLDLTVSRDGEAKTYSKIQKNVKSDMYNFVMIATSIMAWETRYGDAEILNYMLYYPSIRVEKKKQSEGSTIYIISNRDNEEKFMFAVRSMTVPPGLIE